MEHPELNLTNVTPGHADTFVNSLERWSKAITVQDKTSEVSGVAPLRQDRTLANWFALQADRSQTSEVSPVLN